MMSAGALLMSQNVNRRWQVFKWHVKNWLRYRWREVPLWCALGMKRLGFFSDWTLVVGSTYIKAIIDGEEVNFGLAGIQTVTTAGKNYVASTFDNTAEPELFKYHGFGTGTTAAAVGDTALQTELTTQYATDNTRPTGSQAHSTNTYTTVGTLTPDASVAVTEFGLFTATSAGTLLDRQVFSAVNLNGTGDSLQSTYVLTIS